MRVSGDLQELADIESRVQPLLASSADPTTESTEVYFLREKWKSTLEEWDSVQKDAEVRFHHLSFICRN